MPFRTLTQRVIALARITNTQIVIPNIGQIVEMLPAQMTYAHAATTIR